MGHTRDRQKESRVVIGMGLGNSIAQEGECNMLLPPLLFYIFQT
jgi:hypothetical protein